MYKVLKIGDKDYKLEYTIEASLYDEGIDTTLKFISAAGMPKEEDLEKYTPEQQAEIRKQVVDNIIKSMTNLPKTAMDLFYMGLLEHHGSGKYADHTIKSKDDAKDLIRDYFADHTEDGTGTFYDILSMCLDQMAEDGFFKRTGLEKMMSNAQKEGESSEPVPLNREQRRAKQKQKPSKN